MFLILVFFHPAPCTFVSFLPKQIGIIYPSLLLHLNVWMNPRSLHQPPHQGTNEPIHIWVVDK